MPRVKSEQPASELVTRMGKLIKAIRRERGVSVRKLSSKMGISATFLSRVERGLARPNVETLERLSEFFACPLTYFFGGEEIYTEYRVLRGRTRQIVHSEDESMTMEYLTDCLHRNALLEVAILTMKPGAAFEEAHTHQGEEVIHVCDGRVAVSVDGKEEVLSPGESLALDCRFKHNVRNAGEGEAKLYIAASPPNPRLPER